jgi:NitT/TauT family transport system substrate-binding protein
MRLRRRSFLQVGLGTALAVAAHGCSSAVNRSATESTAEANSTSGADPGKISIGFWPIASGLPLYLGVEKGYFQEAGLDVEAVKFASANQVAESLIAGRLQGTGNGVASGALGLAEITSPGLFKIFAANPSNEQYVLEQIIVAKDSPIQSIEDLRDKKVAAGPGAQNLAIAEAILESIGVQNPQVTQLEVRQHVAAIESGQIDAAYTLEPTGTVGELKGITRTLENGVVAKYILGDPAAPWFGGSASLSTQFIADFPEAAQTFIEAYRRAIQDIRDNPDEARQYMVGYTAIEGDLVEKVPLAAYTLYDEFKPEDIKYFQQFFDFMTEKSVFSRSVDVSSLIYKA